MNRRIIWVVLVIAGLSFGFLLGGQQRTIAQAPANDAAESLDDEILEQLKQVNTQLKALNTMFRSGNARVVVVINPDKP